MKTAAMLSALVGCLLLAGSSPAVRIPQFDATWSLNVSGTVKDSAGDVEPYGQIGYATVKGGKVSGFMAGTINPSTGRARLTYHYRPDKAPCSIVVQFVGRYALKQKGTAHGVVPFRCTMALYNDGVIWSMTGRVTGSVIAWA